MSKPWTHAVSSAKRFGGRPEAYLPLHDLMDSTKAHLGDARHRAIFHCREGIELAMRIAEARDLAKDMPRLAKLHVPHLVATQHVEEDLGFVPGAEEWVKMEEGGEVHLLPSRGHHAFASAKKYGGKPEDYGQLHFFLDCRPTYMLHNTLGPFLAEAVFGTRILNSALKTVGVRDVVEDHIMSQCGNRLPSVQDALAKVQVMPWMSGSRKTRYALVD